MASENRAGAEALFFVANSHINAGEFNRAEACLRQAVKLRPEFAEAHANLALVLEKLGRKPKGRSLISTFPEAQSGILPSSP